MTFSTEHPEHQTLFTPPLLSEAVSLVERAFGRFLEDKAQQALLQEELRHWCGRPTPLTPCGHLSAQVGAPVFLKREDLVHGGAHKLNNALGQVLLARAMGFKKVLAETGAGQHGVAVAMAGARLGLEVTVFQGAVDVARQAPNAARMALFGAKLHPVEEGQQTLRDAVNAAFRHWVAHADEVFYCIGSTVGPAPYPRMVRHLQRVIGEETQEQIKALGLARAPALAACVGGGSNASGFFSPFAERAQEAKRRGAPSPHTLLACEAAGAASLSHGTFGILHGMETLLLQTPERQIASTHSISAGLDYPGVNPWLADLKEQGLLRPLAVTDAEALGAAQLLARTEGILPALESAHAVAGALNWARQNPGHPLVVCLSGRGDKDLATYMRHLGGEK